MTVIFLVDILWLVIGDGTYLSQIFSNTGRRNEDRAIAETIHPQLRLQTCLMHLIWSCRGLQKTCVL